MIKLRGETDPERSLTFFNVLPELTLVRGLSVLLGIPALVAAFLAGWWLKGRVWASLLVFFVISYVMYQYGAGYFTLMQAAARRAVQARQSNSDVETALKEYQEVRNLPHTTIVAVTGVVGLAVILWLMRFKPF